MNNPLLTQIYIIEIRTSNCYFYDEILQLPVLKLNLNLT